MAGVVVVQQQMGCASLTAGAGSESGGVGEDDSSEVHAGTIFQTKAIAMEAIRLALQQTPVTDVGSDPNLVARNAVREAMVSALGGFIAGHQAENVGDPSNHDRKVQAFACDMLQTSMDRSSRLQTPASVALDIQALSYRGTPKTSSSPQTGDDVEPGVRFQRGQGGSGKRRPQQKSAHAQRAEAKRGLWRRTWLNAQDDWLNTYVEGTDDVGSIQDGNQGL